MLPAEITHPIDCVIRLALFSNCFSRHFILVGDLANSQSVTLPNSESFAPIPLLWYAAKVKTPNEQRLAKYLENEQVEVFLPIIRKRRLPPQTAFPSYLFVRLDLSVSSRNGFWRERPSLGFMGLVSFGGSPATIDDEVIDFLREQMDHANGIFNPGLRPKELQQGQSVRVISGKFQHLNGVFQRETAQERIVVMMTIFNRPTSVEIDLKDVALL